MFTRLYCVHDRKAQTYHTPFAAVDDENAKRALALTVNDQRFVGQNLYEFPQDFDLYHVGQWDQLNGSYDLLPKLLFLLTANDLVDQEKRSQQAVFSKKGLENEKTTDC